MSGVLERPGGRRIFVSSDCVTPLLATAFRGIFPHDEIASAPQPGGGEDAATLQTFAERLDRADIWVRYYDASRLVANPVIASRLPSLTTVEIPHLNFDAFHPDLFYALLSSGEIVRPHYNSAIVVWAFRHGLTPVDTKRLFTAATFAGLGYFSRWDESVKWLRSHFNNCGLDFPRFFLSAKRTGVFMHAVNHPNAPALVAFAKAVSLKMGADDSVWERAIEISNHLTDAYQWPVYPEIGRHFAVPGSYDWVTRGQHRDLPGFIEASYDHYVKSGISPDDIGLFAPAKVRALFDGVLGARVEELA